MATIDNIYITFQLNFNIEAVQYLGSFRSFKPTILLMLFLIYESNISSFALVCDIYQYFTFTTLDH